jgi:hypothetical protein
MGLKRPGRAAASKRGRQTCSAPARIAGLRLQAEIAAAHDMSGSAPDVASLSHLDQINSALWKLSLITDTMVPFPAGTRAMLQIDPWVKAAECERAIRVVADPERRSVLISLRSLWITLGNEETVFDRSRQAGQVPKIAQIHAELMSLYRNAMN